MQPKIIRNEEEYRTALKRVEALMDQKPGLGTPESDELELLVLLVEHYESEVYPIGLPSPVEAIKFRMDQQGMKAKDLIPYIGSASKVSEVLSGKRSLSLQMIRNLVDGLGMSADVLMQDTRPREEYAVASNSKHQRLVGSGKPKQLPAEPPLQ